MTLIRFAASLAVAATVLGPDSCKQKQLLRSFDLEAARIDSTLPSLVRSTHKLIGQSTEGGELTAYWDRTQPRLFVTKIFGEMGRTTTRYYYRTDTLPFLIVDLSERYDKPLSGTVITRLEFRYYANGDSLLTWTPEAFDADVPQMFRAQIGTANILRNCATAKTPEC